MNVALAFLMLMLSQRGRGSSAPSAKPATQNIRGKSGRLYTVIRLPTKGVSPGSTARFRVVAPPLAGKKTPSFWEADFIGAKPVVASIRLNAEPAMIDDVMAFPPSVWL